MASIGATMKLLPLVLVLVFVMASAAVAEKVRVGHFPNITHAQALVAQQMSRSGKGWFEERLGVEIEWFVYNAGPSAMEAIFADSVDLTYVGPSPAINAYAKARGSEIRVIAGAVNGGAALVVQPESGLTAAADFRGKKIATPQLGNTQDVACRAWLAAGGLKITKMGGDAQVLPTANPDQLSLFQQKEIDAAWTVEPWVSLLETEAGGRVLVEESAAVTTVLVSSVKFLNGRREWARKFAEAHHALTVWIQENPEEAKKMVRDELAAEMRAEISAELIARAWKRISLTTDVSRESLESFVANAQKAGFLRKAPDLSRLIAKP